MALDLANEVVIRWNDPDPRHVPLLQEGGITVSWGSAEEEFRRACAAAGIESAPVGALRAVSLEDLGPATAGEPAVVTWGVWPGVQGRDADVASATRSIWLDANLFRVACLRALHPGAPPVLAYLPDTDAGVSPERLLPFESLELALVEAWAAGGNYVLAVEPRYREALLRGDEKALSAWRSLGRTARWLRAHSGLFRQPPLPNVTVLVDQGDVSHEIANLMFRQSVSPAVEPASNPPPPDPSARRVLVAFGIDAPAPAIADRVLAHATAGATVVVDDTSEKAWWRRGRFKLVKSQEDRDFFAAGKGQVVAYHQVGDPGEFALDVLDLVTRDRRPATLWNSVAAIPVAAKGPETGSVAGRAVLHVVNYGRPQDLPVLARVQGNFERATLLRPESAPQDIPVAKRGINSEVKLPDLARFATVVFR